MPSLLYPVALLYSAFETRRLSSLFPGAPRSRCRAALTYSTISGWYTPAALSSQASPFGGAVSAAAASTAGVISALSPVARLASLPRGKNTLSWEEVRRPLSSHHSLEVDAYPRAVAVAPLAPVGGSSRAGNRMAAWSESLWDRPLD